MNDNLLEYIKTLTQSDRKGLLGKTLKGMEELGELAKHVLPYENEGSTTHRFVTKDQILEDIADVVLVLLSILYDEKIDFAFDQLEEKMLLKCAKWAELQQRDLRVSGGKIPYEIHVTVPNTTDIETFRAACIDLQIKPIFLDLELNDQSAIKDYMTSSVYLGDNGGAIREVERIALGLEAKGFTVVRKKVETVPWHPAAPSDNDLVQEMPKDCYFESHFGIKCLNIDRPALEGRLNMLSKMGFDLHLSKNIFKKAKDGTPVVMSTYRKYDGTFELFKSNVDLIEKDLVDSGWEVDKVIIEFSIYDTKVKHDQAWLQVANNATR